MKNIIICEAMSTGYNLVEDIRRRGYNPVVLESPGEESEDVKKLRESSYHLFYKRPEIKRASDNYDETLALVKRYDPLLIIPGSEQGVGLAAKLSHDLGLLGNPIENIDAMTKKDAMHEALKKAGIRHIRGKVVDNAEDAIAFCRENGLKQAVVKPLQSAGGQGLFLCDDLDDLKNAVETVLTYNDLYGRPIKSVLVQERITGTEYIVNTISCNGKHALNSILRYAKVKTAEGRYIYDYAETISYPEQGHTGLVEYAFRVADAIGFKYGTIHGEYMIDDKGPVLIEVNCRPMGCTLTDEYLDSIFGQHESDSMLDSYLDPEGFALKMKRPYHPIRKGIFKLIMVPEDMEVEDHPIWLIAKQLRSTYRIVANDVTIPVYYQKTRDLETNGGIIFLVHDDENIVKADLMILRETEKKFFSFLLSDGMAKRWFADAKIADTDFEAIIKECDCHGAILAAGDKEWHRDGIQTVTPETIDEANRGFDNVIIGYQLSLPNMNESSCFDVVFKTMDKVKPGGRVIIPYSAYEYYPYKREGAELLLRIRGLTIQVPPAGLCDYVIGLKEN